MSYSVNFCNYTIGTDAYDQAVKVCRFYGKRIMLIHGDKAYQAAGSILEKAFEGSELAIVERQLYGTNACMDCTMANIERMASIAKACHADMIFGMGGGKALDTAKGCADLTGLPVFTFPTIASTCAATTALSVVYLEDGSFEKFLFFQKPARHAFINTQVIADAPDKYLRAGMGDTIGKYFECHFAARGDQLTHSSALGREISRLCWYPLLDCGAKALEDCKKHQATQNLEQAILAIIVSTGLVSMLVLDEYNGAIAHSVYYGLCLLKGFEENNLHGDVVGYGVLVQLAIDHDFEEMEKVYHFLQKLGIATSLYEMGVLQKGHMPDADQLSMVLDEIVAGPDMEHIPYQVNKDMIFEAMLQVESLYYR